MYQIHALPADVRTAAATDPATVHSVAGGGEPLRCCLRDAVAGEELALFNYEPPLPDSPYRERGAVFAHAGECAGPANGDYPPDWASRPQALRAYDARLDPPGDPHPRRHKPERGADEGADDTGRSRGTQPQPGIRLLHVRRNPRVQRSRRVS
jgi:hypothetical protein